MTLHKFKSFFVILFSQTINTGSINTARRMLLMQGGEQKHIQILPLSYKMKQRLNLDLMNWGWEKSEKKFCTFVEYLPDASEACRELKCGCKKKCSGKCKRKKNALTCTGLRACSGLCATL